MKINKSNIQIILVILLLLIIAIGGFIANKKIKQAELSSQISNAKVASMGKSYTILSKEKEQLAVQLHTVEIESKNVKAALNEAGFNIKELKAEIGSLKNLISLQKIEIEASGKGETIIETVIDTVDNIIYRKEGFLLKDSLIDLVASVNNRKITYEYTVSLDFEFKQYYQRDKWYKSKYSVIRADFNNDNIIILSSQSYRVTRDDKWYENDWLKFAVGFFGGAAIMRYLSNN